VPRASAPGRSAPAGLPPRSVQAAGTSDLDPSASTNRSSSRPWRHILPTTASTWPSRGWCRRATVAMRGVTGPPQCARRPCEHRWFAGQGPVGRRAVLPGVPHFYATRRAWWLVP
jgi:hypothetical protein